MTVGELRNLLALGKSNVDYSNTKFPSNVKTKNIRRK